MTKFKVGDRVKVIAKVEVGWEWTVNGEMESTLRKEGAVYEN